MMLLKNLHLLLFVGLDNPQSSDPRYALYPYPSGCAGHRLWQMMNEAWPEFGVVQYNKISKTNLFPVGPQNKKITREAGLVLSSQISVVGWHAVLLGAAVTDAVAPGARIKYKTTQWIPHGTGKIAWIPHPSGRNHDYNDDEFRRKVGKFLAGELKP